MCVRALAFLLILSPIALGDLSEDLEFASRLAERKLYDLTEEFYQRILSKTSASKERGKVYIKWAEYYKERASRARKAVDKEKFLQASEQKFREYLSTAPRDDPSLPKGKLELARIIMQRGRALDASIEQLKDPNQIKKTRAQIVKIFQEAFQLLEQVTQTKRKEFDALLGLDTKTLKERKKQEEQRQKIAAVLLPAELHAVEALHLIGKNLDPSDPAQAKQRTQVLTRASKRIEDDVLFRYGDSYPPVKAFAHFIHAEVLLLLRKRADALKAFDEVVKTYLANRTIDILEERANIARYRKARALIDLPPPDTKTALKTISDLLEDLADPTTALAQHSVVLKAQILAKQAEELKKKNQPPRLWRAKYLQAIKTARELIDLQLPLQYEAKSLIAEWAKALGGEVPKETALLLSTADKLFREEKFKDCTPTYNRVLTLQDLTPDQRKECLWRLAYSYYKTGYYEFSAVMHRGFAEFFSDDPRALTSARLSALAFKNLIDRAKKAKDTALVEFYTEKHKKAFSFLDELGGGAGYGFFSDGLELYEAKKYTEAIGKFKKIPPISDLYDKALYYIGLCFLRQRSSLPQDLLATRGLELAKKAEERFLACISESEKRIKEELEDARKRARHEFIGRAVYTLTNLYISKGYEHYEKALSISDRYIERFPSSVDLAPYVIANRIQALLKTRDVYSAKKEFEEQFSKFTPEQKKKFADTMYRVHGLLVKAFTDEVKPHKDRLRMLKSQRDALLRQLRLASSAKKPALQKELQTLEAQIKATEQKIDSLNDEILASYIELIRVNPNQKFDVYNYVFSMLRKKSRYSEAVRYGGTALTRFSRDPSVPRDRLTALWDALSATTCDYARSLASQPQYAVQYWRYAISLLEPRYKSFEQYYEKHKEHHPRSWPIVKNLAEAYRSVGNYEKATKLFDLLWGNLKPYTEQWWWAYTNSAECAIQLKKFKLALERVQSMVYRNPDLGGDKFRPRLINVIKQISEKATSEQLKNTASNLLKQLHGGTRK